MPSPKSSTKKSTNCKAASPRKKKVAAKKRAERKLAQTGTIEIRGVWQNNLKGIDLDLPLNQLTVVTGPSGSGKSSLAFQTIYAEGQRRYVETFSPYTRQFFDRMDKPLVDEIRGIPPAIAIEQSNNVRTTRSTVGTITEINDYLKLFFPRVATGRCPECNTEVRPETPKSVADKLFTAWPGASVLVTFGVPAPAKTQAADFFEFLKGQGFLRVTVFGETYRTDEPQAFTRKRLPAVVLVIQDRIRVEEAQRARALEAIESAFHFGKGTLTLVHAGTGETKAFSRHWHCADCDITLREPSPALFTFNNAIGACPECRGFGRTIGIDLDRAIPDKSLSVEEGLVKAFSGAQYSESQNDLLRCCDERGIDISIPFEDLPKADQEWIIEGEGVDPDPDVAWENQRWYGVRGFFTWLENNAYKMHVRVYLSRFRSYTKCKVCRGARLQPEALNFRVNDLTLPDWWELPVNKLAAVIDEVQMPPADGTAVMLRDEIASRLRYLERVGLSYLNLDRSTRTLSGGEVERVNLTTCLGASLVNTLFVLDEPSIGLHPRDTSRLIEVMHALRDKGNTLLVVEHEEAVMRAADNLLDIGPGRGELGGELVFQGTLAQLNKAAPPRSLTHAYLSGRMSIPVPSKRRKPKSGQFLKIVRATQNNLKRIDVEIPLGVFCCVTGVSGSGKSTLVHDVLFENLLRRKGGRTDNEPGHCRDIKGDGLISQVIMVDQSPLARTPRSTPAVYTGAFELIRKLFAETPDAKSNGIQMGYFSFNSGNGRCQRCAGNGFEKVEMQFLSDLYVRCPECEGTRYRPEVLEYLLDGKSIRDVLQMTVSEAYAFFSAPDRSDTNKEAKLRATISSQLQVLAEVGLTYLRLGQPLNTLSGGESQRLKLVGHLLERSNIKQVKGDLLIFDEPTTGLHFDDIAMLMKVFHRLVDAGSSVLVIEHNLEVIKNADHVIDLGPEAGEQGGEVVAQGTPEEVAEVAASHTGYYLGAVLGLKMDTASAAEDAPIFKVVSKAAAQTNTIEIHGAREHNLKNIDVSIPRDSFVVVTGLSGSGKSTLAFDIVFAEGQRRFLDSMSPYARQFVQQLEKPDIDHITGLPPTVAIEQRITRGGGKSTVATVTEVFHFLRLMFAKLGTQYCPDCAVPVEKQSLSSICTQIVTLAKKGAVKVMAPVIKARKGFHTEVADWAGRQGFKELYVDGAFKAVEGFQKLARFKEHSIDAVVGEVRTAGPDLDAVVERALQIGKGTLRVIDAKGTTTVFSSEMTCPKCDRSFEELDPRLFSFNSPHGWCRNCRGFGFVSRNSRNTELDASHSESMLAAELEEEQRRGHAEPSEMETCETCSGARLNATALAVQVQGIPIDAVASLPVNQAKVLMEGFKFSGNDAVIARDILVEIAQRLRFLEEVGLGYLALDRSATTLSGGEGQRIRLAAQLGSNLRGVLYVLDEPTIGLHPRDNAQLLDTLVALRDKGNSLLVVEHDEETMQRADYVIDMGPGAGMFGGQIVYNGAAAPLLKPGRKSAFKDSPTAKALADPMRHPVHGERRPLPGKTAKDAWLRVKGARANNLQNTDVAIPLGRLTVITGISGSGKSSLMRGVIRPAAEDAIARTHKKKAASDLPYKSVTGFDLLGAVYEVDQSPIGKTSRSTPSTYVKVFDEIRKLFSGLPTSRMRGYTASRFSFNTEGGRCEACAGNGLIKMEMTFLPTSYVLCDECKGARYNEATLEVEYNGKNIGQVMDMTIEEAATFFESNPKVYRTLRLLLETGLGYLKLGQPSPTLSGGEAQRIKLVTQLTRGIGRSEHAKIRQNRTVKPNLYLIEEPTIGLHMADVRKLIEVLHALVDDGHTVLVIEHNTDIMAEADYIIDIGPEAGEEGGKLVVAGTPEAVAKDKTSRTAPFLKRALV
jgi:excinuclease ABC subunit A